MYPDSRIFDFPQKKLKLSWFLNLTFSEVPMHVFGPEIHMTAIVGMALGKTPIPNESENQSSLKDNFLFGKVGNISLRLARSVYLQNTYLIY